MNEYPTDWNVAELGTIGTWSSGGTPSTSNPAFWGGEIPWISAASLKSFDIVDSDRRVTELGAKSGTRIASAGAVIFIVRGMSLKSEFRVGVAQRDVTFGQDCKSIEVPAGVSGRFLAYALKAKEGEILSMVDEAGHGTGRLPVDRLSKLLIGIPEWSEQREIVRVLDSIDDSVRLLGRLVDKREELRYGLLSKIVRRGLDGRIEKKFRIRRLGDVAESITSGSRSWGAHYSDSGAVFLRIGNLTRKSIDLRLDKTAHVMPPRNSEVQRTAVRAGDVLISITADLGIIGVVPEGLGEAYVNQHVAMVRVGSNQTLGRWIAYYLSSDIMQDFFRSMNDSGAKAGLNLDSVSRLEVAIPEDFGDVVRIVELLDRGARVIELIKAEVRKLFRLKQGLMDDLLTGRVRVKATGDLAV